MNNLPFIDLQWFGSSEETNRVQMTNATNMSIAQQNLQYQREWNEYQKALNEKLMEREDTAIQRQVSDARLAGISPLAASNVGQAQSTGSASVTGQPLNNQFQAQTSQKSRGMESIEKVSAILGMASDSVSKMSDMAQSIQNIRANQQTYDFNEASKQDRLNALKYDASFKGWNLYDFARDAMYNQEYGFTRNMSEKERLVRAFLSSENGKKTIKSLMNPLDTGSASMELSTPRNFTIGDLKKLIVSSVLDEDSSRSPASRAVNSLNETAQKVTVMSDNLISGILDSLGFGSVYEPKKNEPLPQERYPTKNPPRKPFKSLQKGSK